MLHFIWVITVCQSTHLGVSSIQRASYPHTFWISVRDIVITSVCQLCYLLLNHWTESNQIWCVSYSHEWGLQQHIFWPHSPGPGKGLKRSNIMSVRLSFMLSPKPLDEIQPNLVFESLTWMGGAHSTLFWPCLLEPWRGDNKANIMLFPLSHMLSPPKPLDEIQPNLVSYSQKWVVQQHFFCPSRGGVKRSDTCTMSVGRLCYLLLNHWTKSNQTWCVSYSHACGLQQHIFWPCSLGRGQKVKYHVRLSVGYATSS